MIIPLNCPLCFSPPKIVKTRDGGCKRVEVSCCQTRGGVTHSLFVEGESFDAAVTVWNKLVNLPQ